jgi:hypothetical protein
MPGPFEDLSHPSAEGVEIDRPKGAAIPVQNGRESHILRALEANRSDLFKRLKLRQVPTAVRFVAVGAPCGTGLSQRRCQDSESAAPSDV